MVKPVKSALYFSVALLLAAACVLLAASAAGFAIPRAIEPYAAALNSSLDGLYAAVSEGSGLDPRLPAAAFLSLMLAARIASRVLRDRRAQSRGSDRPGRPALTSPGPGLEDPAAPPETEAPGSGEAGAPRREAQRPRALRAIGLAPAAETRRNAAQVALAIGAAAVAALMIAGVAYLYFGPGYIDLGPDMRIERGPRKTFFLRIGGVFGAVLLLHAAYFALLFGGGVLSGKFRKSARPAGRGRKPRRGRAGAPAGPAPEFPDASSPAPGTLATEAEIPPAGETGAGET